MSRPTHSPGLSTAAEPRLSASVVVVNEHNEILLVRRNPRASAFGGMHVFPGGNFDKRQDESLAMTAIRETFEESGLLLATPSVGESNVSPADGDLEEARHDIHQQRLLFQSFLKASGLRADVESLLPFMQWMTPVGLSRRFRTQFYVAFLPPAPSSAFSTGSRQERLPKHDGGQEVIEARFIHPRTALEEVKNGNIRFMPPQFYIVSALSDILRGSRNTPEQRKIVKNLSNGPFGQMTVTPQRLGRADESGRTVFTFEGDETRKGPTGRMHRVLVKLENGLASKISLIRNFDIFNEVELQESLSAGVVTKSYL